MITIEEFIERPELWPGYETLIQEWMKELLLWRNGGMDTEAIFDWICNIVLTLEDIAKQREIIISTQIIPLEGDCAVRIRQRNLNGTKWGLEFRAPLYKWAEYIQTIPEDYCPDRIANSMIAVFSARAQLVSEMGQYPITILTRDGWK